MAEDALELEAYLKTQPVTGAAACLICELPDEIRDQVERAVAKGIAAGEKPRWAAMTRWLKANKFEASVHRLERHFERDHHVR